MKATVYEFVLLEKCSYNLLLLDCSEAKSLPFSTFFYPKKEKMEIGQ